MWCKKNAKTRTPCIKWKIIKIHNELHADIILVWDSTLEIADKMMKKTDAEKFGAKTSNNEYRTLNSAVNNNKIMHGKQQDNLREV